MTLSFVLFFAKIYLFFHNYHFYSNYVLRLSSGLDDIKWFNWKLAICLVIAWTSVYLALIKGIRSLGKVIQKNKNTSILVKKSFVKRLFHNQLLVVIKTVLIMVYKIHHCKKHINGLKDELNCFDQISLSLKFILTIYLFSYFAIAGCLFYFHFSVFRAFYYFNWSVDSKRSH